MGTSRNRDGSLLAGRRLKLDKLNRISRRPPLYAGRDRSYWTDPYVSRHVLEAHLDPHTDDASRRPGQIAGTVETVMDHLDPELERPRLLDLACGPGLYAQQFAARGFEVTGVDFSEVSVDYARKQARKEGLAITYRQEDLTTADLGGPYDVVTLIYGEFCTFSEVERHELLNRVRNALSPGGLFVFDVFTEDYVTRNRSSDEWYVSSRDGFWSPEPHLVLIQHFAYRSESASVARYTLIDDHGDYRQFNVWWRYYKPAEIQEQLDTAGFAVEDVYANLWGESLSAEGEWIGLYARKPVAGVT